MNLNPTHILWDNDGVLVDTEPVFYEVTQRALRRIGIEFPVEAYHALMTSGGSVWDMEEVVQLGTEAVSIHRRRRDDDYLDSLKTAPIDIAGVEPLIEALAAQYTMAIVTQSSPEAFEVIHRPRNITRHMEFALRNGDFPRGKPAPDPYLTALERFGISPDRAIVVEDSARGLRAAQAAGIRCVVVKSRFTRTQDFSGATAIIDSLDQLPEIL
ncbi:MAG TPA: HAD family phosphatase [Pseudomonadales bacterium]|nr:HAD family phosphatase [Pseudomonadales bacterium]